jgi:hypothetical protein
MEGWKMGGGDADKTAAEQAVTAGDFTHNFGRYKMEAQNKAVPVTSHGTLVGYFVGVREYQDWQRLKSRRRRVFRTENLSDEEFEAIASARMDPRHDHLNAMLDPK